MEVVSGYVKPNRQWKVDQSKHDSADACVGFCTADRRRSECAHRPRGRTDRRVVAKGVGGGVQGGREKQRAAQAVYRQTVEKKRQPMTPPTSPSVHTQPPTVVLQFSDNVLYCTNPTAVSRARALQRSKRKSGFR